MANSKGNVSVIREQLVLISSSLEETIEPDNEVRLIDLFVSGLELKSFGFGVQENTP